MHAAVHYRADTRSCYSTFIIAGMDTTSNALSRILQALAEHPDVQEKVRAEIVEAQGGDRTDIPHDDLVKLPYLDAVCRETLRLYAPVGVSATRVYAAMSLFSFSKRPC